MDINFRIE